jgi:ATP-dependent protease HslVU (ClpYQ) peptidase subunit
MTCVIGLEHEGKIWLGADSAASRDDEISCRADSKVFQSGDFLFGFSGSFRIGQLLRYAFKPPKQYNKPDMEYMVVDFIDSLRLLLDEKGTLLKESASDHHDSEIIVGFRRKLYLIESDFNISIPFENYVASGSGSAFALGALSVLDNMPTISPALKIESALKASAQHCCSVRAPFTIISSD